MRDFNGVELTICTNETTQRSFIRLHQKAYRPSNACVLRSTNTNWSSHSMSNLIEFQTNKWSALHTKLVSQHTNDSCSCRTLAYSPVPEKDENAQVQTHKTENQINFLCQSRLNKAHHHLHKVIAFRGRAEKKCPQKPNYKHNITIDHRRNRLMEKNPISTADSHILPDVIYWRA